MCFGMSQKAISKRKRLLKQVCLCLAELLCGQIGRFFILWATFQSPGQQLFCPNHQCILGKFCKGVKIFNFTREILFGQLIKIFGDFFFLITLLSCEIFLRLLHTFRAKELIKRKSERKFEFENFFSFSFSTTTIFLSPSHTYIFKSQLLPFSLHFSLFY